MYQYQNILVRAIARYSQKAKKSGKKNDWALISSALQHADCDNIDWEKTLHNGFSVCASNRELTERLRLLRLDTVERRVELRGMVAEFIFQFKKLLDGDKDAFVYVDMFCENEYKLRNEPRCVMRAANAWLFTMEKDFIPLSDMDMLQRCGEGYCAEFFKIVLGDVGNKIGMMRKRSVKKTLEDTAAVFSIQPSAQSYDFSSDKDRQIDALKFDVQNYVNALER